MVLGNQGILQVGNDVQTMGNNQTSASTAWSVQHLGVLLQSRRFPIAGKRIVPPSPSRVIQKTKAAATATITTPAEPASWFAAPVNGAAPGEPGAPVAVGLLEFPFMLLTIKDGQVVLSATGGFDRVTVTSGTAEGQAVPQGARTVDCEVCKLNDKPVPCGLSDVPAPGHLQ